MNPIKSIENRAAYVACQLSSHWLTKELDKLQRFPTQLAVHLYPNLPVTMHENIPCEVRSYV